jgi:hypothetical protein
MDFVPKELRTRWKALDEVVSFGWCGSVAFGGWLARSMITRMRSS